ncbi:MAG TPA: BlaI/MecI/CopY family transcriptional regulator [Rhodanobacteraceae bacterium]|nr:BlaI/MecI/CopY family transcriptional regulator [Rhodanobacteraceae bacterium]
MRSIRPTEAELEILQVLWERGACTVRDVHEVLHRRDGTGYTTALKLLQIMHAKGLVMRDDSQRAHVYRAALAKEKVQRSLLSDLAERLFDNSTSRLALEALGNARLSRRDLERLRELLQKHDDREKS